LGVSAAGVEVSRSVLLALDEAVWESFVTASKDTNLDVRRKGVEGFASLLVHPEVLFRRRAAKALASMGLEAEPVSPALRMALKDPDSEVRSSAWLALEKIAAAASRESVIAIALGTAEAVRIRGMVLGESPELKAKEPEDRIKALRKIASFGADANVVADQVIEAMQDKEAAVRIAAGKALEQINPHVYPHVFTILHGPKKREAITALGELGSKAEVAIPLLIKCNDNVFLWGGGNPKAGKYYEDLFPTIAKIAPKDKRFADAVLACVSAPNPKRDRTLRERRLAGIAQLQVIEAKATDKVSALVAALEDGEAVVPVIQALEKYGADAKAAMPSLKKLKSSPNEATRNAAIAAIANIE